MKARIFPNLFQSYRAVLGNRLSRERELRSLHIGYLEELAVVRKTVMPILPRTQKDTGEVSYQGDLWSATCSQGGKILPGTRVRVVGRDDWMLFVEPVAQAKLSSRVLAVQRIEINNCMNV